MEQRAKASVISWNIENEALCASAARISTTTGTALELFQKASDKEQNRDLINKVLNSGHTSIIEHAFFSIALENVSAFAEEFFIEHRLASFTVKSRRYVDFSHLGYYIPPELSGCSLQYYCAFMEILFAAYGEMIEAGVPKEDARFLLPYAFNSNFYCTLNARELIHVLREMKYGRFGAVPELSGLADQILLQTADLFPMINRLVAQNVEASTSLVENQGLLIFDSYELIPEEQAGTVELLQAPENPSAIIHCASNCYNPIQSEPKTVSNLLHSERNRELEQLVYTFAISKISLSGITHIVRHRMQSLIVPPLTSVISSKVILPSTIACNPVLLQKYQAVLSDAARMRSKLNDDPLLKKYAYYYTLSGAVTDIMTTINARELVHMIRLRSCNRAQWEIRRIAIAMLRLARGNYPTLFRKVGPNCYMYGTCPEKRLSCGKQGEVLLQFS